MTPEQFEHWQDFCFRMITHANPDLNEDEQLEARTVAEGILDVAGAEREHIAGWDGQGGFYVCDHVANWLADTGHLSWDDVTSERDYTDVGMAVACAVRAGLDMACQPSGGVLGYDMDDIRRMYPECIPAWLAELLPEEHATLAGSTPLWL